MWTPYDSSDNIRHPRRAHRPALLAALLTPLLLAACGDGGGTATEAFGARAAPVISLSATLTIGGTYSVRAAWTDNISAATTAPSCEAAAKGFFQDGLRYILPRSPLSTPFDGHAVGIVAGIAGYHGPASYDAPAVTGADGTPSLITVDGAGWAAVGGGTAHVDVKADDSGTLVFNKLGPTPPTPPPAVSGQPAPTAPPARAGSITGTLTWTCTQQRGTTTPSPSPSPTPAPVPTATPPPAPAHPTPTPSKPKPAPTPTPKR